MNQPEYAITSDGLTKRLGHRLILDSVSLRVPVGAVYGLLGPNGAGKTTLINCLLNLLTPTRGTATLCGYDVVRQSVAARRTVGHVSSLQPLWDWMRIREYENLLAGCFPRWNHDAVAALLARVEIDPNSRIQNLSRGQRALASLAIAIGHEPEVLILDEALTGIDPVARAAVIRSIIDVIHAGGRTVLITGQDITELERICDYIGFLIRGQLVTESSLDDLKARMKRICITHEEGSAPEVPSVARHVERQPRETRFSVMEYTPALLDRLAGLGRSIDVTDLDLEEIFLDLVVPEKGEDQ